MINDFYIEKEYFSDEEMNKVIDNINNRVGMEEEVSFRVDGSFGQIWRPFSEFKFSDFYRHSNLHISKVAQAYLTFPAEGSIDQKKVLKFVSDRYNLKVEELQYEVGNIQIYLPGSFIGPHSDRAYEGAQSKRVCAVLIPLNSRPQNASGGELIIGDYEYVPNKGDIVSITMDSDKLHEVKSVIDWFRFMITLFVQIK